MTKLECMPETSPGSFLPTTMDYPSTTRYNPFTQKAEPDFKLEDDSDIFDVPVSPEFPRGREYSPLMRQHTAPSQSSSSPLWARQSEAFSYANKENLNSKVFYLFSLL